MAYKTYLRVIWLVLCGVYLFTPLKANYNYNFIVLISFLYLYAIYVFYKIKRKVNYFDFDSIFIFANSIMGLLIPLNRNSDIFNKLTGLTAIDIDPYIAKGMLLSVVGTLSFMNGSISKRSRSFQFNCNTKSVDLVSNWAYLIFLVSSVTYVLMGGINITMSNYNNDMTSLDFNPTMFQMISLITMSSIVYYASLFYNRKNLLKSDYLKVAVIACFATALAIAGNRTIFTIIVVPFVFCFSKYVKPFKKGVTLMLLIVGAMSMYIIQLTRQGRSDFSNNMLLVFTDLTFPSTNNYLALSYVEHNGCNFGSSFIYPLYQIIPGLGSYLGGSIGGSAEVLTKYARSVSEYELSGLGTTCISDIYISFGFIGVIILMFYLGFFLNNLYRENIAGRIIECGFFSACIFMCRSSLLMPMKDIIWGILLVIICNSFCNSKKQIIQ